MPFIGLELDRNYVEETCGIASALLHVTLVHLPDKETPVPMPLLDHLANLARVVGPQRLQLSVPQCWGPTLYVRRAEGAALRILRSMLTEYLTRIGIAYSSDFNPWEPHLTVGGTLTMLRDYAQITARSSRLVLAGTPVINSYRWELVGDPDASFIGGIPV